MIDAALLVASCDKYSDLWEPFFTLFHRHWPDCPFPIFLGSNRRSYNGEKVTPICVGQDVSWADNLQKMLDHIPFRRVILFLEDFLMVRRVDTQAIQDLLGVVQEEDLACLRLYPHPPPSRRLRGKPGLGELRRGDDYRVSTQVAIWDVGTLRALAWPGLSAWDFEIIGSLASNEMSAKFWGVYEPVIDYRNGVWRGRWLPEGLEICSRARVDVDLQSRDVFAHAEFSDMRRQREPRELVRSLVPTSLLHWRRRMLRLWHGRSYMKRLLREAGLTVYVQSLDSWIAKMRLHGPDR